MSPWHSYYMFEKWQPICRKYKPSLEVVQKQVDFFWIAQMFHCFLLFWCLHKGLSQHHKQPLLWLTDPKVDFNMFISSTNSLTANYHSLENSSLPTCNQDCQGICQHMSTKSEVHPLRHPSSFLKHMKYCYY